MARQGGFQPKGSRTRAVPLPGTRVSLHNSQQLLVSTGIPSMDAVLGGGLPVGSLLLLEEDQNGAYAEFFLKCFLAEGVTVGNEVLVASLDKDSIKILNDLPAPVDNKTDIVEEMQDMKIAWRYQQQKKVSNFSELDSFGHHFDLKVNMPNEQFSKTEMFCWSGYNKENGATNPYRELFKVIDSTITSRQLSSCDKRSEPNIIRIGIHSIASFSWGDELSQELSDHAWSELTTFFSLLKATLRQSFSVGFVTVPFHRFVDQALMARISQADYIVGLESFQGTDKEVNPLFKDYHGLFNIYKISAINGLVSPSVDTKDWVFKLKRKKLCVEKLHIPPDLSETVSRSQSNSTKNNASLCSGSLPNKLDF